MWIDCNPSGGPSAPGRRLTGLFLDLLGSAEPAPTNARKLAESGSPPAPPPVIKVATQKVWIGYSQNFHQKKQQTTKKQKRKNNNKKQKSVVQRAAFVVHARRPERCVEFWPLRFSGGGLHDASSGLGEAQAARRRRRPGRTSKSEDARLSELSVRVSVC